MKTLLALLLVGCSASKAPAPAPSTPEAVPEAVPVPAPGPEPASDRADVPEDINANFLDPELEVALWIERFEGESREVFASREAIVAALELDAGQAIADIGAGTGLFEPLFAQKVGPEGTVYAVEISPRFLDHLRAKAAEAGLDQVAAVEGTVRSVGLEPGSVDVVFVCDTYHHFEYPQDTLASIHEALRPGGRLVVVDFEREEGVSSEWILGHVRAGKETVASEIAAAGFTAREDLAVDGLKDNYALRFTRP